MGARLNETPEEELARLRRQQASLNNLIQFAKTMRALAMTVHNSSDTVEKLAPEFFYAAWDLMEGRSPEKLELKNISKEDFLQELKDG
jgi:hypothetical protein